jgi:TonB family protein
METLADRESAVVNTEPELHLLLERDWAYDWRRWRTAGIVSLAAHAILIVVLILMPEDATTLRVYETRPVRLITPLYIPTELTQKAPNKGKLSKELTVEAVAPRPVLKAPAPPPPPKQIPPSAPLPPQITKLEPKLIVAEPPKIQAEPPNAQQPVEIAKFAPPPPPPPNQQPKLVMENVVPASNGPVQGSAQGGPQSKIAMPNTSVEAAVRDITKTGALGSQSVADTGADDTGTGLGISLPPSIGRPFSSMELKSDPMGVDFRPYMRQILLAIKRNWLAVYPEAARLGQRGETILEFAIAKQGLVAKVVYSTQSGMRPLDEAAVAAISASNPLPPLPREFKGDRIVLRMTFKYNMPR